MVKKGVCVIVLKEDSMGDVILDINLKVCINLVDLFCYGNGVGWKWLVSCFYIII